VGKVPDPKAQVEQITTALIYKFMDDMDKESMALPKGKAQFFTNGYQKYAWNKLMDPRVGGHERLSLYVEAITRMSQNPRFPQLFRDIFKDAFLPYRDPETLNLFLKEINGFTYDHSENLGDAFEYLLSILGSQGEAGQFRTPRHIIDFIVEVVDPKKDETILDPACGTAGFLISAYKHILEASKKNPLTPDEKKRLMTNLAGYDISPDMVKLSLVNMYLHGFPSPNIYEYDTLTSEERWDERFDVIMANPPFMTPKGGIRPHKRFMAKVNRSEVLFVDYIMEHLNNKGRAGLIVPEGIIFQSGIAYKQLRKLLVEDGLYAVVSLPQGVFNPYSGVKTSILFFDNYLAKRAKDILFVKVTKDGFNLGAQRRPLCNDIDNPALCPEHSDFPAALEIFKSYQQNLKESTATQFEPDTNLSLLVSKETIAQDSQYYLASDMYREAKTFDHQKWPIVKLAEVVQAITPPKKIQQNNYGTTGKYPIIDQSQEDIAGWTDDEAALIKPDKPVVVFGDHTCAVKYIDAPFVQGADGIKILITDESLSPKFLYYFLKVRPLQTKGYQRHFSELKRLKIPLPPLEIQHRIASELDGYQEIIDGAEQVVENYKPTIKNDPSWEVTTLENVCVQITDGTHKTPRYTEEGVPFLRVTDLTNSSPEKKFISKEEHQELIRRCKPEKGDVLYSKNGTIGVAKLIDWNWEFSIFVSLALLKPDISKLDPKFLELFLNSPDALMQAKSFSKTGTVTNLHLVEIKRIRIPLPSLEVQQNIISKLKEEGKHIESVKILSDLFQQKIKSKFSEVLGE